MKIFWSWQSDIAGKISRHFIRSALEDAVELLRQPKDIEEPSEREQRESLHLDHDRKGVSGSPDLANTILQKIEHSQVFVADVTPVAELQRKGENGKIEPKKIMNPNVAIELGYALKALSDKNILFVMNKHFGERQDLPFDLAHKAGPIFYDLDPGADNKRIKTERTKLAAQLKKALEPFLSVADIGGNALAFREAVVDANTRLFFSPGDALANFGSPIDGDEVHYKFQEESFFYVRLLPPKPTKTPFRKEYLKQCISDARLPALHTAQAADFYRANRYGAIGFDPKSPVSDLLKSGVQVFDSGEMWAFSNEAFAHSNGYNILAVQRLSAILSHSLPIYLRTMTEKLNFNPSFQIEFGVFGLEDHHIGFSSGGWPEQWRILEPEITKRYTINSVENDAIDSCIRKFLDDLFDLTGHARPEHIGPQLAGADDRK